MTPIFLGRTGADSGHTLLAWVLGQALRERGVKLGIFQPYGILKSQGSGELRDRDLLLLSEQLQLEDTLDRICPIVFPAGSPPLFSRRDSQLFEKKVLRSFDLLSKNKDVVLILGSQGIFFDSSLPGFPDSKFIKLFRSKILLIDSYREDHTSTYSILSVSSLLPDFLEAVIINRIPPGRISQVRGKLVPFLKAKGAHVSAAVPEDPVLASFTVERIARHLNAGILCGEESLMNLVERGSLDSSYLDESLGLLRKMRTKILLLGRKAAEAQLQENPLQVAGIVITSGRVPGDAVTGALQKRKIPLLQVKEDTFTVLEKIESAPRHLSPQEAFKVERFRSHLEREEGMGALLDRFLKQG